jgi:hypothetical protein
MTTTRRRRHGAIAAAVVVLVVLDVAVGGAAWATWTTPHRATAASVSAGSVSVALTGSDQLATTYSSSALGSTALVSVRDTGSVPATGTLTLSVQSGQVPASALRIEVWQRTSAAPCSTAPTAASVLTGTGASGVAVSAALGAGVSASWCVRTSIGQGTRFDLAGGTVIVTANASAVQGSWVDAASARSTQTIADTVTPGAPSRTSETDDSIVIAWAAPADTSGVAGYEVFRDGVLIATVPASTRSVTDTGLVAGKYYAYTVRAVASGAAGHHSPLSSAVQHATDLPSSTGTYRIRSATGQCIAAGGTDSGSPVVTAGCRAIGSQTWQFTPDGTWVDVSSPANPTLFWDAPSNRTVILRPQNSISAQRWAAEPLGTGTGTFQLRNKNDLCLVAADPTATQSTPAMTESECDGSPHQQFTLQDTA